MEGNSKVAWTLNSSILSAMAGTFALFPPISFSLFLCFCVSVLLGRRTKSSEPFESGSRVIRVEESTASLVGYQHEGSAEVSLVTTDHSSYKE